MLKKAQDNVDAGKGKKPGVLSRMGKSRGFSHWAAGWRNRGIRMRIFLPVLLVLVLLPVCIYTAVGLTANGYIQQSTQREVEGLTLELSNQFNQSGNTAQPKVSAQTGQVSQTPNGQLQSEQNPSDQSQSDQDQAAQAPAELGQSQSNQSQSDQPSTGQTQPEHAPAVQGKSVQEQSDQTQDASVPPESLPDIPPEAGGNDKALTLNRLIRVLQSRLDKSHQGLNAVVLDQEGKVLFASDPVSGAEQAEELQQALAASETGLLELEGERYAAALWSGTVLPSGNRGLTAEETEATDNQSESEIRDKQSETDATDTQSETEMPVQVLIYSRIPEGNMLLGRIGGLIVGITLAFLLPAMAAIYMVVRSLEKPIEELCIRTERLGNGESEPERHYQVRELERLNASFTAMEKRILTAQEEKQRVFVNISHDLRTPLAAIIGYASGIQEGLMESGRASDTILKESYRMQRMLESTLLLGKLDTNAWPLQKVSLNLTELLEEQCGILQQLDTQKKLEFAEEGAGQEIFLCTDPDLLIRILQNIVSNCMRHAESRVEVSLVKTDQEVHLIVSDDGPGIAPEELPHILERYYRGAGGEYGIGLSVVAAGARYLGGSIAVSNKTEPRHGAVYHLRLPEAAPAHKFTDS